MKPCLLITICLFQKKRLAASICSDTGYLLDGALLFHVCSEIRSSSHGVRIAYSLQHKYDRLTSISCYSSSTHSKDGMDVLLVSRKNDPVGQSGKGKSVYFGIGVASALICI